MLVARYYPYLLQFKTPGGTSRGVLTHKKTYFVEMWNTENPQIKGWGEAALFEGLSSDDVPHYEQILQQACQHIHTQNPSDINWMRTFPSIRFGFETAMADLQSGGEKILFRSAFTSGAEGIKINGLIWMGNIPYMLQQIQDKLNAGFECLKLKISEKHFQEEWELIKEIRNSFNKNTLEIRVDANGAFTPETALQKLEKLAALDIHSIEQPIKQGQWLHMAQLCQQTPLPIALDEELIGLHQVDEKRQLLENIRPQYIILKPSLVGGFEGCNEWIHAAQQTETQWWITSALESNIGLNAIAQYTFTKNNPLPQGLGTGQVFTNNIPSGLYLKGQFLFFSHENWNTQYIFQ